MTIDTTKANYPQCVGNDLSFYPQYAGNEVAFSDGKVTGLVPSANPHKMTNREWIQSLSDEEVARFIHTSCPHDYCEWSCSADNDCIACITKWLKAKHREVSE